MNIESKITHSFLDATASYINDKLSNSSSPEQINEDKYHPARKLASAASSAKKPFPKFDVYIKNVCANLHCTQPVIIAAIIYINRLKEKYPKFPLNNITLRKLLSTAILIAKKEMQSSSEEKHAQHFSLNPRSAQNLETLFRKSIGEFKTTPEQRMVQQNEIEKFLYYPCTIM